MQSSSLERTDQTTGRRIPYLDFLRSIAIVSITFNHAVNRSFAVNSGQFAEFQSIPFGLSVIKAVLCAFSRIGVPLFVMITGALLLPREYTGGIREGSVSRFLKHNWLRLFITTEIWLAIMFWYMQLSPDSALFSRGVLYTFARFVLTLLFLNPITMASMWYMEMILCVYLVIPIIAIAVKHLDSKYFLIPAAIVVFCSYILRDVNGVVKALGYRFAFSTKLDSANIFSMYVVYLLLGYYVSRGALQKLRTRVLWLVMTGAFVCFCIFQTWFFSVEYDFVVAKGYRSIFPMLVALPLFELMRRYKSGSRKQLEKLAEKLSLMSFGIYFVHICIMQGLVAGMDHFHLEPSLLLRFILLESVSFFGSILIIMIVSKSKPLRRLLFNMK
jgi:surface polysaccharide O-acyltransferase-like enzyme